jgi:hypothetical protein
MPDPFFKFICTECGHRDTPCRHWREMEEEKRWKFVEAALCELNTKEKHELRDLEGLSRKIHQVEDEQNTLSTKLDQILDRLTPKLQKGSVNLMPKTIAVGGTSLATLALVDTTGAPMVIDATYTVQYSASNPASVSVGTVNPDGSAVITGVSADPGNTIGATVTRPDGVVITLSSDTLVITAVTPPAQVLAGGAVVLT